MLLGSSLLAAAPQPEDVADPQITAPEIVAHVKHLASAELTGRGSGTTGNDMAGDYLADRFRAVGLKPAGTNNSYFQSFPVFTGVELGDGNKVTFRGDKETQLAVGEHFLPLGFSKNGGAYAPVVFAGYGISKPDLGWDDYKRVNVKGKIVIVLRHTPDMDEDGKLAPYAALTYKVMTAREKGAVGVLLVTGPLGDHPVFFGAPEPAQNGRPPKDPPARRESQGAPARGAAPAGKPVIPLGSASSDAGIPAAIVRPEFVDTLMEPTGKTLKDAQMQMAHGLPAACTIAGARIGMRINVLRQTKPTRNVLGLVEGSDPKLKDEVVVIGAHYDHLGMGNEHSLAESSEPAVHHGADDNASGTAAVLELAQYLAANRTKLGRSVLLMGFSGEELGLLGSNYWVKHPTIPLGRVVGMINLDMVGRMSNDTCHVIGAPTSPTWAGLLEAANKPHGLRLKTDGGTPLGGSDHQSFVVKDIPVLFFFTGVHPDYHRPSDTWEKLNAEGTAKISRIVADVTQRLSWEPKRPQYVKSNDTQPAVSPGFRVYLGTIPDYAEQVEGVMLQGIREGSPADKAGLKGGDIIVEFGGKKIRNVQEYTTVLSDAKPNAETTIAVTRKGERRVLKITPAGRR
ncbi:MAG: M28 family peptidase [Actinomycetota bacterium]